MEIGVPKEIKDQEFRVGLNPSSVKVLCSQGHQVFIETSAGEGSSFSDQDYKKVGAKISDRKSIWNKELIVKVKEPLVEEYQYFKKNQILFTYLHLAANRPLTEALVKSGITAIAYETVAMEDGKLPLLTPMSIIAGRLSIQIGARYLEKQQGGRGILLGGIPGVSSAQVVILGGGVVGSEAARIALGMGAKVQIFDINVERLRYLETIFGSRVELLHSNIYEIEKMIPKADLLIGAVLIPGRRAPILVPSELVSRMSPGSVIIDVAVDQGGCIETLKTTSHSSPTYLEHGIVHFGVPNMPGAVPWTATQALNNSTLPYVSKLANYGLEALKKDTSLEKGLNVKDKSIIYPALKEIFNDIH
ncbi:alanine dehydrogenase [Candidatus Atelocyanobacterium thalassae]|uniref:Alanine dehydrogenase n=2 Tax=Candidatus Atelocyanobacterium thalassae TaxID=713887 RepID=A0A086CIA5_9CHRO|nr:alanine dehydrogenase [Candidatus Atelocyanobacterium thalassa]KFF41919.1 MAG: L-alanine dehydrogenase [Candidatus Atelocyanobacterium thalassa isolate SIO64986]BDA40254.1 alanine dehydrogenase [cyanobacterium endosymbiont of Braarudosphaera bigelowii]